MKSIFDIFQDIQAIIARRHKENKKILTPSMVARELKITFVSAVSSLEKYRAQSPQTLEVRYRALCDHCEAPYNITDRFDEIVQDRHFHLICKSCSNDFEATGSNTLIEYVINFNDESLQHSREEVVQGGIPSCRIERTMKSPPRHRQPRQDQTSYLNYRHKSALPA